MPRKSTTWVVHDNVRCNCHNCTKRHLACHDTCEDYKAYRAKIDEIKKREHDEHAYSGNSGWVYVHKKERKTHEH